MTDRPPFIGGLGRIATRDPRDAAYPLRAITQPALRLPARRSWRLGPILDQGATSACVGFSGRQYLTMTPVRYKQAEPSALDCYTGAQANDGIPLPHDGSNARGVMQYLRGQGLVESFHWASTLDEAIAFVLTTGPILCGMNWHEGQFTPDAQGIVHPTGAVVGGHEFVWHGYDRRTRMLAFANSWGQNWGVGGRFFMGEDDFAALFADGGDLCAAVQSPKV